MKTMTETWKQSGDGSYGKPLGRRGAFREWLKGTEGIEGLKLVRGRLLTRTNHEPPAHFQALGKRYPEEGTRTVIADTDTNLNGRAEAQKGAVKWE